MKINEIDLLSGISEVGIDRLISDIYDYAESCNNIIGQIDDKVQSTKEFFKCNTADLFRQKFRKLFDERSILNYNILSYSRDLAKVKAHYKRRDIKSAEFFKDNGAK